MRILIPILILCLISCTNQKPSQTSYWETQKSNFKYQDRTEFLIDSAFRTSYKQLPKANYKLFSKTVDNRIYLYSWQNRNKKYNEFTVIRDNGEHGLQIYYCILDKKDSLISSTQIAGRGGEGGFLFEKRSKFLSRDSLLNIASVTLMHNSEQNLKMPIGDTTFSYMLFGKGGKIKEKKFREVNELQYDKIIE